MPILLAWLLAQTSRDPVRMDVLFAGSKVGESLYDRLADGTFRSTTRFSLGPAAIDTTIEGRIQDGRILSYQASGNQGPAKIDLHYVTGKLTYALGGRKGELAYTIPAYAGSLHPQLSAKLLTDLGVLKADEERKVNAYLLDVGSEVPVSVRARTPSTIRVEGRDQAVRRFGLTIGPTEIEYDLAETGDVVAMDVPGQRLRFVVKGWEGLFDDPSGKHPDLSQPTYRPERLKNLRMKARDGVTLVADAVRPSGRGRFPAILERTPYGRETSLTLADWWAARGYVYVAQDCRGRGDSDGDWDPFMNEGKDGYDAIAWVARQPWCDGKVGTIGGSYAGTDQWQAAVERPPALRCIVPQVATPDAMRNLPYEYGTFFLYGSLWWSQIVAGKNADFSGIGRPLPNPAGLRKLPLRDVDKAVFGRSNPIYQRWLRRTTLADWKGFDQLDRLAQADVPALHISGWYDGDGIGTTLNWEAMRRAGRKDQWLVDGPWTHAFNTTTRLGDEDFGSDARFDLDSLTLRFFDTYLKARSVGMEDVPHVQAFVTGANRWISLDGWPASTSPLETLYFGANTLAAEPCKPNASVYVYDPAKDTNVGLGGEASMKVRLPKAGTYALFKGEPMMKPTALAGPFEVRMFFKSNAKDTDFFSTLLDVAPDGTMRAIGLPGKLRASYRDSLINLTLLTPGMHTTALMRPWDSAHEFGVGHRLALLVNSSMFPAYARNLGTGEPIASGKRMVVQRNVILTGTMTPSRITFRKLW